MDSFFRGYEQSFVTQLLFVGCFAAAWLLVSLGNSAFAAIEKFGSRLAARKWTAVAVAAAAPILIRICFLPALAPPLPQVHDEASYLLAGDTFAHGRLTNPPHPMSLFFETFHINQHPTYMSKYPPAQGAALAIGQLLGHPWIGVLLSVGAMCGAIVWMLQGWVPRRWALLGGVLAGLQYGAFNYWTESYWGGAMAAIGGALVLGAFPRILRHRRPQDALAMGCGAAVLANSRPWEGAILCATVGIALAVWLVGRKTPGWRVALTRIIAPMTLVLIATGLFMAYYNYRGTGNALLFPYQLNDRAYFRTPLFAWQPLGEPKAYTNPQFDRFYNDWARDMWASDHLELSWRGIEQGVVRRLAAMRDFYLSEELCVPILLTLPWLVRNRKLRLSFAVVATGFLALVVVIWYKPHYAAPITAAIMAIVIAAMRYLRRWKYRGQPIGIGLTRSVVLLAIATVIVQAVIVPRMQAGDPIHHNVGYRAAFERQLEATRGEQLIIVRYSPEHDPGKDAEWVYNRADIDGAKIVWAREIPGVPMQPLLEYFGSRHVWLAEPDAEPPRISTYPIGR
jgi:hypothetical protein